MVQKFTIVPESHGNPLDNEKYLFDHKKVLAFELQDIETNSNPRPILEFFYVTSINIHNTEYQLHVFIMNYLNSGRSFNITYIRV